jgi:hypothetical protein
VAHAASVIAVKDLPMMGVHLITGFSLMWWNCTIKYPADLDLALFWHFSTPRTRRTCKTTYAALAELGAPLQGIQPEDFADRSSFFAELKIAPNLPPPATSDLSRPFILVSAMRLVNVRLALLVYLVCSIIPGLCQDAKPPDAREIVRKSIQLDQTNWLRRADYTWVEDSLERHFDAQHRVTSEHQESAETIVLDGEPYERKLERDHKPLSPAEQKREQEKLDKISARLEKETPEQKQRRAEEREKARRREREFLLEIIDAYDFRLEPDQKIDGHDAWVISGAPKPGYHAKSREGAAMLKIQGKIWIEKAGYEWVRIEGETTGTISFGWFLARLNPGAKMVVEQSRINDEVWLPTRMYVSGSGRLGLVKRISEEDLITWSNYRKFRVESKIVAAEP